jgi:hypothetical protein
METYQYRRKRIPLIVVARPALGSCVVTSRVKLKMPGGIVGLAEIVEKYSLFTAELDRVRPLHPL